MFNKDVNLLLVIVTMLCCSCGKTTHVNMDDLFPTHKPISQKRLQAFLTPMGEKQLSDYLTEETEACYRFVWLRSFHDPMIFRIHVTRRNTATITVKKLKREVKDHQWHDLGLCRNETHQLTVVQYANFMSFTKNANFWKRPSGDPKRGGLDGASWILEGITEDGYHLTDRWSPLPPYIHESDEENLEVTGDFIDMNESRRKYTYPPEAYTKHQDEVALDVLCLYILCLGGATDEVIY